MSAYKVTYTNDEGYVVSDVYDRKVEALSAASKVIDKCNELGVSVCKVDPMFRVDVVRKDKASGFIREFSYDCGEHELANVFVDLNSGSIMVSVSVTRIENR